MSASDDDEIPDWMLNNELYIELTKAYEPTPEDIAKELSPNELKMLCLRTKCRVDMWKWNPVEDFASEFREDGRFVGKSKKFINKLLLKAYRNKVHYFKVIEEEQIKEAELEWQKRKKLSLLRLNQWRYEEEQRCRDSEFETVLAPEYEPIETEIIQSMEYLEESIDEILQDADDAKDDSLESAKEINVEEGAEFEVDLHNFNSESLTVNSHSIPVSEMLSEVISLNTSQLQDAPVIPYPSQTLSQGEDYRVFEEFIPIASTQDAIC